MSIVSAIVNIPEMVEKYIGKIVDHCIGEFGVPEEELKIVIERIDGKLYIGVMIKNNETGDFKLVKDLGSKEIEKICKI